MATVHRVSSSENIATISEILERDGCIVIENILSPVQIQRLKAELNTHFLDTESCAGDFYGYKTKRLSGLMTKSVSCQDMAIQSSILSIMDEFLLKGCRDYQLNLTQAISIGPGEPEQIIHPDDPMFPFEHPGYQAMINCMWAVDDFTTENGATCLVPGSHKWPKDRYPEPHEITQGVMPAGSVLIYFGYLLHGGGANRSSQSRIGVVLSYCLGWLRQAENSYLAVPQREVAALPERLQRLLGYFVHKPNLGCVDGQDPIHLLQGHDLKKLGFVEFLPDEVKPLLEEHQRKVQKTA